MKKKFITLLLSVSVMLGCTGCTLDYMPDLTDEQVQEIGEYVAVTMMNYDMNVRSRLAELDESDWEPIPTKSPEATEEPEAPEGMGPVEDTPVIDVAGGEQLPSATVEEVLTFEDGLSLTLVGYDVCDSYPEGDENPYFALNAVKGKKLLAVKLNLSNSTDKTQSLNMLSMDEVFTLKVNEEYNRRCLTTMLDNDLSTFMGEIPAGASREVVLLVEIDEILAGTVTSIELKVKNEEKECTIDIL